MSRSFSISIVLNLILGAALLAMLGNIAHPFQDPAELMRAMQMGWAVRGLAEHNTVDTKEFELKCMQARDYDDCRLAEGHVVNAVRLKYGAKPLKFAPKAQSSVSIDTQRP